MREREREKREREREREERERERRGLSSVTLTNVAEISSESYNIKKNAVFPSMS